MGKRYVGEKKSINKEKRKFTGKMKLPQNKKFLKGHALLYLLYIFFKKSQGV